jgi:hypothetical protein
MASMTDPMRSPALAARLQRAASEISGMASSRARRPDVMAGIRPFHFSFTAAELVQVLRRNGIEVSERDGR